MDITAFFTGYGTDHAEVVVAKPAPKPKAKSSDEIFREDAAYVGLTFKVDGDKITLTFTGGHSYTRSLDKGMAMAKQYVKDATIMKRKIDGTKRK